MSTRTKESFRMESSVGNIIYCCVSNGDKILYMYNGGGRELEAHASLCLENCPPFHSRYFHTVGDRTYGFLVEDGLTYFGIVDASQGSWGVLRFLEQIRDGIKKDSKNGFQDELMPVIRRLMQKLESMAHLADQAAEGSTSGYGSMSTEAPLLGKGKSNKKFDKKKSKDWSVNVGDGVGDRMERGTKMDMPQEQAGERSLQKSLSARVRQQTARRLWCRHVKIVIAIDVLVCLVLFGIWLAVCNGFKCVSG